MRIENGYGFFDVNLIGEATNQSYMGNFQVKCLLSPMEQIKKDKLYRDLLGTNSHLASTHVSQLAYALSELHIRVVEHPVWWKEGDLGGGHINDPEVLLSVLESALECQADYIIEKKKEMKEKQDMLANMIRKKVITPELGEDEEPIESLKEQQRKAEEEPEIDLGGDDE